MRIGPIYVRAGRFVSAPIPKEDGDFLVTVAVHALERARKRVGEYVTDEIIVADVMEAIAAGTTKAAAPRPKRTKAGAGRRYGRNRIKVTGAYCSYIVEPRRRSKGWFVVTAL